MKRTSTITKLLVVVGAVTLVGALLLPTSAGCTRQSGESNAQKVQQPPNPSATSQRGGGSGGIIVDYTCLDLSRIPDEWIEAVKSNVRVHYAHTSHGGQVTAGLRILQSQYPKYACAIGNKKLPTTRGALCIFDGQERESYISPDLYWATPAGRRATHSVLQNNPTINVSLWSWCCQQTHNSKAQTQAYLDAMDELQQAHPNVVFVYMTGNAQAWHGHHSYKDDKGGYTRYVRNEQIRQYCRVRNKPLYDFADIESWYGGRQATSTYQGNTFPREHDHFNRKERAHTSNENCLNKAKAFWWLLARIAGWQG
ncbi:MAG: hypothetical protein R6V19_04565 [Armatimonadota bacterium]